MSDSKIRFQSLPLGICPTCLKQMSAGGLPCEPREIEPGVNLLAGYCMHREAGFWAIFGAGVVTEWTIRVPIPIETWQRYIDALPNTIRGVHSAMLDSKKAEADSVH